MVNSKFSYMQFVKNGIFFIHFSYMLEEMYDKMVC